MTDIETRTEYLKAIYWSYEETDEHELYIYLSGITKENKTIFVRIENFTPYVYLQLPKKVKWDRRKCRKVFEYFQERMKSDGPLDFKMYKKYLLHYKKEVNTIFLTFPTHYSSKKFNTVCSRGRISIPGVGSFSGTEFLVHEHNIDPILKFTSCRNIKLASWIKVKEKILDEEEELYPEERKFTSCDIDMYADWDSVSPTDPPSDILLSPQYCSFDIECYSVNHNSKLPDPEEPKNVVFQISLVFGRFNEPREKRKKILLTLFDPLKIKGVEVKKYKTEKELLIGFTEYIQAYDPDIFIGYNIIKFDWNYMIIRSTILGIYPRFAKVGRILGQKAALQRIHWASSAYGVQDYRYLDCQGRLQMDVLIEIERNYKLPKYSLDYTAGIFLNSGKEDVSPRQLFMLYQITDELLEKCRKKPSRRELIEIKKKIKSILSFRRTHGAIRKYREELLNANSSNILKLIRKALTIIGIYCVQDTDLPIDLVEKLNLMTTMEEMTNCMHIPMSYLHTRGQQIKVLAQVYRETLKDNIIIPYQRKDKDKAAEKFQGAVVIEAHPGDYDDVVTLDFASLYPTMMITYNICYSTILEDDDPTPNKECHVIQWSEHKGCITKDSKVTLINRSKRIQNSINQKLFAWNKKDGVEIFEQTNFFNQGIKECIRLTFEDGTKLECTPDHRILSGNEWIEAQDLEIKQIVKMTYNPPEFIVPSDYEFYFGGKSFKGEKLVKLAQLIGLICTDGHLVKGRSLIYVGHKMDIQSVRMDLKELFGEDFPLYKQNYGWSFSILGDAGEAFRKLKGINLKTKASGRVIPYFFLQQECPEGIICAFLSGMFGGDGHTISFSEKARAFTSIALSWSSTNESELKDVFDKLKMLLERVGFHPVVLRLKNNKETSLRIPINETLLFHEKIGFAHCVHKAIRLEAGCLYLRYRKNVWEQQKRIIEYVRNKRDAIRKKGKRHNLENLIQEAKLKEEVIFNEYYGSPSKRQMTDLLRSRRKQNKPMFSRKYFPGPMEYMEKIGARGLFSSNGDIIYAVHKDNDYLPMFDIPLIHKKSIGKRQTYDLEVKDSHSFIANGVVVHNCPHDPQKRKVKAEDIMCADHYYRFRKVKIVVHDDGAVEYLYQGIMPRLEQRLLTERKGVKKELFKMQCRLRMQQGKCTQKDIDSWGSMGMEIIKKGQLGPKQEKMLDVCCNVLNAKQLALKVSANSVGGNTPIPCLVNDKFEYKAIEEISDGNWEVDEDGNEFSSPRKEIKVWSDIGFTEVKYVFRHKFEGNLKRILTESGCVECTEDHSLVRGNGKEVKPFELKEGDKLLYSSVPLPQDTPKTTPFYDSTIGSFCPDKNISKYLKTDESRKLLNANLCARLAFIVIYSKRKKNIFRTKNKIKACNLVYLWRSIGRNTNVIWNGKYELVFDEVKKKLQIEDVKYKGYVYDIETESHHFAAGVGDLIVHNSAYGAMGARNGFIPLIPGAASVTAKGRWMIIEAIKRAKAQWPFTRLVYGDSVTPDTPILCRRQNNIYILPIDSIHLLGKSSWEGYPGFKLDGVKREDKERFDFCEEIEVWCGKPFGWKKIRRVIKHKVEKDIYRVATRNGVVDVTEDHSLLKDTEELIKPKNLELGNKLLSSFPTDFEYEENIQTETIVSFQKKCTLCTEWKDEFEEFHKVHGLSQSRCKSCRKKTLQKGLVNSNYFSEAEYNRKHVNGPLSSPEAWVWGFFLADGSCGRYEYKNNVKYSWAINNQNLDFLEKAKEILEKVEPFKFKILDTMKSSGVYKLVPSGYLKYITTKYRRFIYFKDVKYVHSKILNASKETRKAFFDGYYHGDGYRAGKITQWGAKGKLVSQGLYYIAKSIGYENLRINEHSKKPDFYTITHCDTVSRKIKNEVRNIKKLGRDFREVYDIETECGRFQAGVGEIVVSNTDSCMLYFEGKTLEEAFVLAEEISILVTHYLKCMVVGIKEDFKVLLQSTKNKKEKWIPINKVTKEQHKDLSKEDLIKVLEYEMIPVDLEFENAYGRFVLLTKKRYVAYVVNKKGEIMSVTKKGVVLARRDNCKYLRDSYKDIIMSVLDNKSEKEIMYALYDRVQALFTRQILDTDLIIYVGVKDVKEYAKKRVTKEISSDENPFIDKNGEAITDVTGPLDPRLEYRNMPQCLLALKMLQRGDDVPPNTRLELLYLENPEAEHQGDKAEDFTYYRENKDIENFKPDYLHYVEKQLTKPVTELLSVKFPSKPVLYEKIEDALDRVLKDLDRLQSYRISKVRVFRKPRPLGSPEEYVYRGKAAKVEHILESSKKASQGSIHEIDEEDYPELIQVCKSWKARNILNRLYSQYGMKKRPSKRPFRNGDKLPVNQSVMLKRKCSGWPVGSIGEIVEIIEEGGDRKTYKYNILMDSKKTIIIKEIPRSYIGTYIFKDGTIMKDILVARTHYKEVIEHLAKMFVNVKLVD